MTVRELIEELQRQPNLDLPVQAAGFVSVPSKGTKNPLVFESVRGVTHEWPYVKIDLGWGARKDW